MTNKNCFNNFYAAKLQIILDITKYFGKKVHFIYTNTFLSSVFRFFAAADP